MAKKKSNAERVTEKIIAHIEDTGLPPWSMEWSSGVATPMNHVHENAWTGCNIISAWVHNWSGGYTSNRFLTFNQIKKMGLQLKGEKGDKIREAMPLISLYDRKVEDKDGNDKWIKGFSVFNCFNIEQIEGVADPGVVKYDHDPATISDAVKVTKALGVEVRKGPPSYSSTLDIIKMPDLADFTSPEAFISTMFHESGHATGHSSRLDRKLGNPFGSPEYAKEELIAELTAAFLCAEFQIEYKLEQHASYLKSWLKAFKSEPSYLIKSASEASKAVAFIKEKLTNWDEHAALCSDLEELHTYDAEGRYAA
jgi:antirestriction protein ArdC